MKRCSRCQTHKPFLDFAKNISTKDGYSNYCRICQQAYVKDHYSRNKPYYMAKARKRTQTIRELVGNLKKVPCKDCKMSYPPWVMDFDHLDSSNKLKEVSILVGTGSLTSVYSEIEKCDIVCSNCHRQRTHNRKALEAK